MLKFVSKIESSSIGERFEFAKSISEYVGMMVNSVFLGVAIAAMNSVDASSGRYGPEAAILFGKYTIVVILYFLSALLFAAFVQLNVIIIHSAITGMIPLDGGLGRKPWVKWPIVSISFILTAGIMIGLQVGFSILMGELKGAQIP